MEPIDASSFFFAWPSTRSGIALDLESIGKAVQVVGHQAVAEQLKGVALFGGDECLEEGDIIGVNGEDISAVVAARIAI
jgi:hypothetical protein